MALTLGIEFLKYLRCRIIEKEYKKTGRNWIMNKLLFSVKVEGSRWDI
jgi:hypothetical protein